MTDTTDQPDTDSGNAAAGLCQDCASSIDEPARRCPQCASPRIVWHEELDALSIAHIDCDAFYAAVEKRDNPDLVDKPVIIGGGRRGVVSTACYMARIRGVRSAMPMFKALAACPDAVVIKPNMEKYAETGRQIRSMMRELTPVVEPLSIDEAFLDLTGTAKLHRASPAMVLARFARRVESETGLTVSVGLSYCKFLAKIASDLNKPRGYSVIGRGEALAFLRRQPVGMIWGVGKATQALLAADGIETIAEVQDLAESDLASRYGSIGLRLSRLSRGLDERRVEAGSAAKSISSETTFNTDLSSAAELMPVLRRLSERVSKRLKDKHLAGQTVTLKLKTTQFKSRTRNRALADPTQLADRIFRCGSQMLEKEIDGTRFRLIGIGVSGLRSDETADPEDLVDFQADKRAKAERAMDRVRERFGRDALGLGINFKVADQPPQRERDS